MNIQVKSRDFFSGACYAYCIAWIYGGKRDWPSLTFNVAKGLQRGYIDEDGYVSHPVQYVNLISNAGFINVVHKDGLPPVDGKEYAVMYKWKDKTHFVVVKDKEIVFDPWENSDTVKYGIPFSYREFL